MQVAARRSGDLYTLFGLPRLAMATRPGLYAFKLDFASLGVTHTVSWWSDPMDVTRIATMC